jgi:hypothetical protein
VLQHIITPRFSKFRTKCEIISLLYQTSYDEGVNNVAFHI